MSTTKFVSQSNATSLMEAIGAKFSALKGAYVYKGSTAFASLPASPTPAQNGYTYNITDDFTTDARFVEGAGKKYSAGTDVVIVDLSTYDAVTPDPSDNPVTEGWYELVGGKYVLSTDTTVDAGKTYYEYNAAAKFNIASSFVNVDAINARIGKVADMIAAANFNVDSPAHYDIGDIVKKDDVLYRFKVEHTAGAAWADAEVDEITVEDLIDELTARINALLADLAPAFNAATAYTEGQIVTHGDGLYKFKAGGHTAGDPWSDSEVDSTTLAELIQSAEPTALTTQDVNDLIALLD